SERRVRRLPEKVMLSIFCSPSRYTQGKNATASLGKEMANLGLQGPALILAGRSAHRLLSSTWAATFGEAGIKHAVYPFGGECSLAEIERVKSMARQHHARLIVGAGGGKVLDTARAVAADLDLPVVNCPTVASSDAPCSALSVIYTEEGVFQEYRFYRKNPDLVLVDTQVIALGPPRLLVAGMGDALATWFEAKTCVAGHVQNMRGGASTRSALALAELCYHTPCWQTGSRRCVPSRCRWSHRPWNDWWKRTHCSRAWGSSRRGWRQRTRCTMA